MADDTLRVHPPTPVAQENKTEESPVRDVDVQVTDEQVAAQVAPEREAADDTVREHVTEVTVDEVITDPNSPLAVQVPPEGRGNAVTPIAAAYHGDRAATPEERFAAASKPARKRSDDKPNE